MLGFESSRLLETLLSHETAGLALDQSSDLNVVAAKQQATFPVTGNGTILCSGRVLTD